MQSRIVLSYGGDGLADGLGAGDRAVGRLVRTQDAAVGGSRASFVSWVPAFKCRLLRCSVHLYRAVLCEEFASENIAVALMRFGMIILHQRALRRSSSRPLARASIAGSVELEELILGGWPALLLSSLFRPLDLAELLWNFVVDVVSIG